MPTTAADLRANIARNEHDAGAATTDAYVIAKAVLCVASAVVFAAEHVAKAVRK